MQVLLLLSLLAGFSVKTLAAGPLEEVPMIYCDPGKLTTLLSLNDQNKAWEFVNTCVFSKPSDVFVEELIRSKRSDLFFCFWNRLLGNNLLSDGFIDYAFEVMLKQGHAELLEELFEDPVRMEELKWSLMKAIAKTGRPDFMYLIFESFTAEEWASPQMEEYLHLAARLGKTLVENRAINKAFRENEFSETPEVHKDYIDVVRFFLANGVRVRNNFIKHRADVIILDEEQVGVPYQQLISLISVGFFADYPFVKSPFYSQHEDFHRGMLAGMMPRRDWQRISRVVREMIDYSVNDDDILRMRDIITHVPLEKLSKRCDLHNAILNGSQYVAKTLIEAGVDINAVNEYGSTPLELAIQCFDNGTISLLFEKNVIVDRKDEQGNNSALVTAIENNDSLTLGKILERCQNIDLTHAKYHELRRKFMETDDNPESNEFNKNRLSLLERTMRGQVKRKEPSVSRGT